MPQINLTRQQDDQYDSFSVYRSTSTIDDYNLPEPIAENIIEPQYSDNNNFCFLCRRSYWQDIR